MSRGSRRTNDVMRAYLAGMRRRRRSCGLGTEANAFVGKRGARAFRHFYYTRLWVIFKGHRMWKVHRESQVDLARRSVFFFFQINFLVVGCGKPFARFHLLLRMTSSPNIIIRMPFFFFLAHKSSVKWGELSQVTQTCNVVHKLLTPKAKSGEYLSPRPVNEWNHRLVLSRFRTYYLNLAPVQRPGLVFFLQTSHDQPHQS